MELGGDICMESSLGCLNGNTVFGLNHFCTCSSGRWRSPSRSQDLQIKPPSGEWCPRDILKREHGAMVMLASRSLWGFGLANPCCLLYNGICWSMLADNAPQRVSKIPIEAVLLPSPPSNMPPVPFAISFTVQGPWTVIQNLIFSLDTWRPSYRDLRTP